MPKAPNHNSKEKTIDCNLKALEIAIALNYLKNENFSNALVKELKKKQTYPFDNFSFFVLEKDTNRNQFLNKNIKKNNFELVNFKSDLKLLEIILTEGESNSKDKSKIHCIIENGATAYIETFSFSSQSDYKVTILKNNIIIEMLEFTIE